MKCGQVYMRPNIIDKLYTQIDQVCRPGIPQLWYWHSTVRQGSVRFNLTEDKSATCLFRFPILPYYLSMRNMCVTRKRWLCSNHEQFLLPWLTSFNSTQLLSFNSLSLAPRQDFLINRHLYEVYAAEDYCVMCSGVDKMSFVGTYGAE